MQPGQTITPGSSETPTWQYNPGSQPAAGAPQPAAPPSPQNQSTPLAPSNQPPAATQAVASNGPGINWTASEFIAHAKSGGWYVLLAVGALTAAAGVYWFTKDKISAVVIIIVAIIFGIAAGRQPRELQYEVNDRGVNIGGKAYPYIDFKSFSIVQEDGVESIWFMPLKRFKPMISIYFDPNDGDKIIDILSRYLPVEAHDLDPVDRLMHRLRF